MSEHTPGPWVSEDLDANFIAINDAEGNWVGEAYSKANARIMIAAPDLLETLENLERTAGLPAMSDDPARVAARAAISKAKGEQE